MSKLNVSVFLVLALILCAILVEATNSKALCRHHRRYRDYDDDYYGDYNDDDYVDIDHCYIYEYPSNNSLFKSILLLTDKLFCKTIKDMDTEYTDMGIITMGGSNCG